MKKIGIDIDGTVYPWTLAVNEAVAERFDVEGLVEHTHWQYLKDVLTPEQWAWVWTSDAVDAVFGRIDLIYPGAADAVNALCNEHEVHFVTHRHPYRTAGATGWWLNRHFRNYAGVHVTHNRCEKHTLADWDVFIDDKPETIAAFVERTSALMLVPARPWNVDAKGVRFDKWSEVSWLVDARLEAAA